MTKPVMHASSARRRGFTLTEIAIVLGIIGIILGAIWAAAAMVYENNRTKEAREQSLAIINSWHSIYGSRKVDVTSGTDMTQLTFNNGFYPLEMTPPAGMASGCTASGSVGTACFLSGPWTGSDVSVISDESNNAIKIEYQDLAQTSCNHFANGIADAAGLIGLEINGTSWTFPPLGTTPAPLSASTISGACTNSNGNSVIADFGMN